ncbi:MAG TPA: hypothetical protein VFO73_11820 [Candidatus Limnocylindrales bacterium]|nr:hypothetical protein [Candidatus Limnocylindrales bacterium]
MLPRRDHRDLRERPTPPQGANDRRSELLEGLALLGLLSVLAFIASASTALR